ncbi:ABC transporter substrate-binding protein [Pandoraea anhela]|uniref:Cysteine ABC transporter substrate-binding protein n=1 Tax=Pandoraea anhela TaxID=2508295 RepID=A0A5E4WBT6_9BURK|nr:ABC transporter substrate-binding protein [Pandoraea anhela]VVE21881.1 cysteine ABC transporter substrate-binding protein [Pandoraea anhela]
MNRQKLVSAVKSAGIVAVTLGFATGHAWAQTPPTIATGTLTIGSDLTYPPYDFLEKNEPAGFDPEFMTRLAAHLKLTPKFVDTRFANLILGITAQKFDVISSALYVTPERARQVDFIPYFKTGGSLLARADGDFKPKTPEDLCGKRIGSIKGAAWIPKLRDVSTKVCVPSGKGAIDVREFESSPEAAQALIARAVDAQYDDAAVAKSITNKLGGRVAITSNEPLYPVVVGLAVKKGNGPMLDALKQAFDVMKRNGEYAALLRKYNVAEPTASEVTQALAVAK